MAAYRLVYLMSPAGWLPRTGISSGTIHSIIEYGLPLPFFSDLSAEFCVSDKFVQFVDDVMSPDSDSGSSEKRHVQSKRQLKKPGYSQKAKKLVLRVYGMSTANIDSAIQDIESLCKDCKKQKSLKSPQIREFLSKMTQDQVVSSYCTLDYAVAGVERSLFRLCFIICLLRFCIPYLYLTTLYPFIISVGCF